MARSRELVPLPFPERDPARLAETVRRVSAAYGVAGMAFSAAFVSGLLGPQRMASAWVSVVAAAGFLPIAASARRWPAGAGVGFVLWTWVAALAALVSSSGRLDAVAGLFFTAIVAAGLILGVRWAIACSLATAAASAAVQLWFAHVGSSDRGGAPSPLALWSVTMMSVAALPVLLGESLGQLRRALTRAERVERQYRFVADNARDVIWLMVEGKTVYVSPASKALFGWSPAEMIARAPGFESLTADSAQVVRTTLEGAIASGAGHARYEAEHVRHDGSTIWCEVEVSLRRGRDGRVRALAGVTRDISARRRSEAEREKIQAELIQAQKMEIVGTLAAGVAHDLNNQLTVILASAEALLDDSEDVRNDAQKDILDSAQGAAALTRQLQMFSRRHVTAPLPCDLSELVRRSERTLRRVLGPHVELLVASLASPAVARVDPAQLEQAILNLAVNARDAMPGGGRLTIEVAAGRGDNAAHWLIRVGDTGTGIDAATRARIFEPFFTTKPEGRGTGLGLSMVRRIVEEAGGRIGVETRVGLGTTFELALPRHDAPLRQAASEPSGRPGAPAEEAVLVVDDSPEVRRLLCDVLGRSGYRVLDAHSPASALSVAASVDRLELVVTDVAMAGRSGPELVAALRRQRPSLPVLYVTGDAGESSALRQDPLAGVLWKPFSTSALLRAVRDALDGARCADGNDGD